MGSLQASYSTSGTGTNPHRKTPGHTGNETDNRLAELVSVIIPCYNHGQYLPEAIESVLSQSHTNVEVIVIDDGSTDCTKAVMQQRYVHHHAVKYIYQHNQGLSAARNAGIANSSGSYIIFLDADDWLVEGAIETNINYLQANRDLAFVSGAHVKLYANTNTAETSYEAVESDHYLALLRRNYIGMHATVMYCQWVFDEFAFDHALEASEDYDMYLRVARKYPVHHHEHTIAVYRLHNTNTSADINRMLRYTMRVLKKQRKDVANKEEQQSLITGIDIWQQYYSAIILRALPQKPLWPLTRKVIREHYTALRYHPRSFVSYLKTRAIMLIQRSKQRLKKLLYHNSFKNSPPPGHVRMGDFNRTKPFSTEWGYDRGGPVDRYYIEHFLAKESGRIKGRVLEIGDNEYTLRFGGSKVIKSEILHVDATNAKATYVGDLTDAPHVPDNTFDCIVLTQTLHLIYNYKDALQTCYRVLKPGGVLLLTVPGISQIDYGEWSQYWMWSFTSFSIQRSLSEVFGQPKCDVQTFGNVLAASAFLYGMGRGELKQAQLDDHDPKYQVIITAVAIK